ncbi:g3441 [Coccomyxa elongata]
MLMGFRKDVNPNNKRGDEYGPLWPVPVSIEDAETGDDDALSISEEFITSPIKGTLCAGNYALTRKSPEEISRTGSRFPYADRFHVGGCQASSSQILEALIPQVLGERLDRIKQVAGDRCHSILPVVEGLIDRGNVGALCRSADALGFGSVHCIDTSPEKVKSARGNRTSKGSEKWLDVQRTWGTRDCVDYLRACGYRILVTQLTPDSVPIQAVDWTQPTAFILGNEVEGASDLAVKMADQAVTVPMAHSFTESFNVSVAAALILNEARQQRIIKLGSCGDLSPEEIQTLTAIMLLKHRGGNALSWHPHWRQHAHRDAGAQQPLAAILQAV